MFFAAQGGELAIMRALFLTEVGSESHHWEGPVRQRTVMYASLPEGSITIVLLQILAGNTDIHSKPGSRKEGYLSTGAKVTFKFGFSLSGKRKAT